MTTALSLASLTQTYSTVSSAKTELTTEVENGTVSSSEQTALSSAIDDIGTALQSDSSDRTSTALLDKINTLIASKVEDGTLTEDEADDLTNIFANAIGGSAAAGGGATAGTSDTSESDDSTSATSEASASGSAGGAGGAGGGGGSSSSGLTDPADANGDGTVTTAEQMAYDLAHPDFSDAPAETDEAITVQSTTETSSSSAKLAELLETITSTLNQSSAYQQNGTTAAANSEAFVVDFFA